MAIICRDIGLLFIMTPRTGCMALGALLLDKLGGEWVPSENVCDGDGRVLVEKIHCTLPNLLDHQILTDEQIGGLLKITTVRNPFDSLVSLYTKRRSLLEISHADPIVRAWMLRQPLAIADAHYCPTHSFDAWIRRRYGLSAIASALRLRRNSMFDRFTDGVDVVMHKERLQEDWDAVCHRLGLAQHIEIPRRNPTEGRGSSHREHYKWLPRLMVQLAFRHDLRRYQYSF